jgi:bacillithiol biosynthesis cysteine-adding enzyme BshC
MTDPAGSDRPTLDLLAEGRLAPLAAAFLAGRDRDLLAPLVLHPHDELPPAPDGPAPDRRELAQALAAVNTSYGHPAAAELARKLADPATRVIVTGQQPGLFGGPLYSLAKAAAAARWAARLEAAGQPAVAVFWVATEDHDFDEVASAVVTGADGPARYSLGDDPEPLVPVGVRSLGPPVAEALAAIAGLYPEETPRGIGWRDWWSQVGTWYSPNARFGEAFTRLMVRMLGPRCPLLLDALLPQLKAAQQPWLRRAFERRREVAEALTAAAARIEERGFSPQVRPQPDASPLFLLDDGRRRRIEWRAIEAGDWKLRGAHGDGQPRSGSLAELLERLDDNPIVVSPGALARPAIQDAVLGTTLQLLGPGELSYMAQAAALYPVLEIAPPRSALRPQVLVMTDKELGWLAELGLSLEELTGEREQVERRLAELSGSDVTTPLRALIEQEFERYRPQVLQIDATLEAPWDKTRDNALRGLENFAGRLAAAAARNDEVRARRLDRLRDIAMPLGGVQERTICAASLVGRFGDGFGQRLYEQLDLDPRRLQIVIP